MRTNLPVTSNAYTFPADQTLISVTDLKGRITYCNANFVNVSGFLSEELLGQPHNIVRHPDMPEEAFRDMWQTIQVDGLPWSALVKNRRKNGDYYWVRANATPVRDGDRTVGFLSVRTRPAPEEIDAFERLYATMRAEAAAGKRVHMLRHGEVVRNGLAGSIARALHPGLKAQLIGLLLWSGGAPVVAGLLDAHWWVTTVAAMVSLPTAAYGMVRLLISPLKQVVAVANRMAAGDLTQHVEVNRQGEIGQLQLALAQMNVSVRTVVRDVRHEVVNLKGGVQEISAGAQDMSSRTDAQASNLEQTAASMEEISGTVKQTAHLASEGAAVARETAAVAKSSHEAVLTVSETMQKIAESSRRIGEVVQVIEGVAFQTNLLALNAAVEAARAGDKGRGFAVVATEVRELAQRASSEAKAIRQLIGESTAHVDAGSLHAAQACQRVDEALESVRRVTGMLDEIHNATHEQADGIAQIASAVNELDSITQQNATMVEEFASSSSALQKQVDQVHSSIRVFKLVSSDTTLAEVNAVDLRKQLRPETGASEDDIDFDRVIKAHHQWRITLRNSIARKLKVDVDTLRRDDCCELGRWLHGPAGQRWGSKPVFTRLLQKHREFHQEAGKIGELINQHKMHEAEVLVGPGQSFHRAGQQVVAGIEALRDAVRGGASAVPARASTAPQASDDSEWDSF